ncbi:MAG: hypothetical protein CMJ98_07745 [Planctomycetes bacterium]|nr:hypothetical protein [Planctomycetota bacterium]
MQGGGAILVLSLYRSPMATTPEPRPISGGVCFEEWDFAALGPEHARSIESNDRRLMTRRRLLALGKDFLARAKGEGVPLDARSSLHHPHAFNGKQVSRLWVYLMRPKAEKTRLRKVLGRELAKDLDSAYRNAYLCVAVEHQHLEVSLRIHADAWYDGQNLVNRVGRDGLGPWLALLNELSGFQLRLHDWRGEWPCGNLTADQLTEFLRHYTPGEHQLVVDRRWPVPPEGAAREAALGEEVPGILLAELERLLPMYRYAAWSQESDHLFS